MPTTSKPPDAVTGCQGSITAVTGSPPKVVVYDLEVDITRTVVSVVAILDLPSLRTLAGSSSKIRR
jgi:hypothetical protein